MQKIKPIAIYLPQFHPIPENDQWWGRGFTEWINVVKSKPKFKGHYQPHLPKDLGFYDLRVLETMEEQSELAKYYGIHGFCYYHYWFNGKLLLQTPIEQMLASGRPNMPFCLCWANENWSRRWDGSDHEVLIEQHYSLEDDKKHIEYLLPYFRDERYIKIDGKPVFLLYRSELHPKIKEATALWRRITQDAGFPDLYLVRVEHFVADIDPESHGFDAGMEFAPDSKMLQKKYTKQKSPVQHFIKKRLHNWKLKSSPYFENRLLSYPQHVNDMLAKSLPTYRYFRCVAPGWDNSARRVKNATIYMDSTPEKFKEWTFRIKKYTEQNFDGDEQIFFINAWNEWAEGCHLEPDQRYGSAYLEAFQKALEEG